MKNIVKNQLAKLVLRFRRIGRLIKITCPVSDFLIYTLILMLWIIYALLINAVMCVHDGIEETYLRTLWDLRNSVFSSIVLASVIGAFNHLKDYRKMLKVQHFLYVDTMIDFEAIFSVLRRDDVWYNFHPLYNENCLKVSLEYAFVDGCNINIRDNEFLLMISTMQERLDTVAQYLKDGRVKVKDEEMLMLNLNAAKKAIIKIVIDEDTEEIKQIITLLYLITDELRFWWRRDTALDIQVAQRTPCAYNDFYKRMWLSEFDINMAKKW